MVPPDSPPRTVPLRSNIPLSEEQEAIVRRVLGKLVTVVAAGAGSGKTYTMATAAIEMLLLAFERKRGGGDRFTPSIENFIFITFTNKAANAFHGKLRDAFVNQLRQAWEEGDTFAYQFWQDQMYSLGDAYIGTIHSFCRMLLRTHAYTQAIPRSSDVSFSAYVQAEAIQAEINERLEQEDATLRAIYSVDAPLRKYELVELIEEILDEIYNRGLDPSIVEQQTVDQPPDEGHDIRCAIAELVRASHERFERVKKERHVLGSHQLLTETRDMLCGPHGDEIVRAITKNKRYLFVDEFQDTDSTQVAIINRFLDGASRHSGGIRRVLAVGDEKQSIYAWRGSTGDVLDRFAAEHGVQVLPMHVSRRPTQQYLDVSNALVGAMGLETLQSYEGIWEKTTDTDPPPFAYLDAERQTEASRIRQTANAIKALLRKTVHLKGEDEPEAIQPGHIVVLARSNRILESYVAGLREHLDVPVELDRGAPFYRRPEIVSTYFLLRLLERGKTDAMISAALDTPYMLADARKIERDMIEFPSIDGRLWRWLTENQQEYARAYDRVRERLSKDAVPQLLEKMYRAFEIRAFYRSRGLEDEIAGLNRLHEIAQTFHSDREALSLRKFLNYLKSSILSGRDEKDVPTPDDGTYPAHIRLMTVHRAKGLDFPFVVVPEAQQPMVQEWRDPDFLVLEPDGATRSGGLEVHLKDKLEVSSGQYRDAVEEKRDSTKQEEKRILYVAVTRAEHGCCVTGSSPEEKDADSQSWRSLILDAKAGIEANGGLVRDR